MSFSRCGRCTRPLTGPLTTVEDRSRLSGDRLPRLVDTISSTSAEPLRLSGFATTGCSVTGIDVGWGKLSLRNLLACSRENASFAVPRRKSRERWEWTPESCPIDSQAVFRIVVEVQFVLLLWLSSASSSCHRRQSGAVKGSTAGRRPGKANSMQPAVTKVMQLRAKDLVLEQQDRRTTSHRCSSRWLPHVWHSLRWLQRILGIPWDLCQ